MFPGQCVVARLELAQTQKRPAGGLVRELDELRESRLRIRVAVGIIIERAEVKPAFGPFGLELEGVVGGGDGVLGGGGGRKPHEMGGGVWVEGWVGWGRGAGAGGGGAWRGVSQNP